LQAVHFQQNTLPLYFGHTTAKAGAVLHHTEAEQNKVGLRVADIVAAAERLGAVFDKAQTVLRCIFGERRDVASPVKSRKNKTRAPEYAAEKIP